MRNPLYLFLFCISVFGCASKAKPPISDHYDGSHFFNPTQTEKNGFWRILKLLATVQFKEWPKSVENEPKNQLNAPLNDDQVAVTFVNHATVLLQIKGFNILTDPVWSERVSPVSWAGPKRVRKPGVIFEDLPYIDLVVVSHNHYDHMDIATLKRLQKKFSPRFLVPMGDKEFLVGNGLTNITEMDWWNSVYIKPDIKVTFTPTQHLSARGLLDWNKSLWGSYLLDIRGRKIYFGGDAAYSSHYVDIKNRLGEPDISFLPIGAYEPRWFMKHVHMNPADAVQAHIDLGSKESIGIHFGTFQQTNEAIDDPTKALEAAKAAAKLDLNEFYVLKEGVTRIYSLRNMHF